MSAQDIIFAIQKLHVDDGRVDDLPMKTSESMVAEVSAHDYTALYRNSS